MKTIGFGIIGIGRQGLRLAEHIRKDVKSAKLIAVCRRSQSGHDYSKEHGLKFYSNYHDLLADKDINAVIITTPSSLHAAQTLDALKAKKHVLVDKPVALTVEEGRELLNFARKQKLIVAVNFPLRVNPATAELKKSLEQIGKLKKIQVVVSHGPIRSKWQNDFKLSGGGVILDLGNHYFDLIYFLKGCRPEEITNAYSEKTENEHSGFIDIRYKDFGVSMVLLRDQKLKKNFITFAGDKGFAFADYSLREVVVSTSHVVKEIKFPPTNDFETILQNMVNAINKKEKIIADAGDGIESLKAALSVYWSIKTNKPVRF